MVGDQGGARHLPSPGDDARELEERHRAGEGRERVFLGDDELHAVAERLRARGELRAQALDVGVARARELGVERLELPQPRPGGGAALARDLAPDEVHRLDSGGALVDRGDARVTTIYEG